MNVYILRAGNSGAIKIGVAMNVDRRIATLQTGNAFKLNLLAVIKLDSKAKAYDLEAKIHRLFSAKNIRGEWFHGTIDFRKLNEVMTDSDTTRSSKEKIGPTYVHRPNYKKRDEKAKKKKN